MGEIRNLLIGLIVFSGILLGSYQFLDDSATHIDNGKPVQNVTYLNSVQEVEEIIKDTEESFKASQLTGTPFDIPLIVANAAYNILKLILERLTAVFQGIIDGAVTYLFLPDWVRITMLGALAATVVLIVVSAIMRWDL